MDHQLTVKNFITKDQSPACNFPHQSMQLPQNFCPCRHCTHHHKPEASPLLSQSSKSSWCHSPSLTTLSHHILLCCYTSSLHHDGAISSIVWQLLDCHAKGYIQASSGEIRALIAHGDMLFTPRSGDFEPRKFTPRSTTGHFKNYSICKPISLQHKNIISCMVFNHVEGILYGSFDGTVKVWKLSERQCVDSFVAHDGDKIDDMVINQQSRYLFTCGEILHTLIKVLNYYTCPNYALALSVSPSHRSILYSDLLMDVQIYGCKI